MRQVIIAIAFAAVLFSATCGGHQRNGAHNPALTSTNTTPAKTASIIPAGVRLAARDAGIALSAGGCTLSWKYENPGDYSQDGIVALEDIAPLTEHWGEAVSAQNEWIDGSGDGAIGVADITPIAMNWGSEVTGYRIDGADTAEGPWNEAAQVELAVADASGGRLAFTNEIAPGWTYYRIVTLTPDGDGAFSEPLVAPSNEPIIYGVSPTSGYQHEEYTFTATASGQEPLTYAWDFGGGGTPNTSSDISPTVTLSDAGEYSATLTISNSYGPTTFPFTLTVSARDTWAHTWGGGSHDEAKDMAFDGEGNIYIAGLTNSFGAEENDVLALKYSPEGDVLWARMWGAIGSEFVAGCATVNGEFTIIGHSYVSGERRDDIYILKYNQSGELMMQAAWGTNQYDRLNIASFDAAGNIYAVGSILAFGSSETRPMVAMFSPEGQCLWAKLLAFSGTATLDGVIAQGNGALVVGTIENPSLTGGGDGILLNINSSGEITWAERWDTGVQEGIRAVQPDPEGGAYALGWYYDVSTTYYSPLLLKIDTQGTFTKAWEMPGLFALAIDSASTVYTSIFRSEGTGWYSTVYQYNVREDTSRARRWHGNITNFMASSNNDLFLIGASTSHEGLWEDVPWTITRLLSAGATAPLAVTIESVVGSVIAPEGKEAAPTGVIDIGGGYNDVLIMKNTLGD